MNELVSIILPCFNVEKYLKRCVEDLEKQTYPNIEILLIDDVSQDNTVSICGELQDTYQNIRLFQHKKNMGPEGARNTGLQNARGTWVKFIDPDDLIENWAIESEVAFAEKHHVDFVFEGFQLCYSNKKVDVLADMPEGVYTAHELVTQMEEKITWPMISCIGSKLYRMEFLKKNKIYFNSKYHYNEDGAFGVQAFGNASRIGYLSKLFYKYMQNQKSYSRSYRPGSYETLNCILELYQQLFEEQGCYDGKHQLLIAKRRLIQVYDTCASEVLYNGGKQYKELFQELSRRTEVRASADLLLSVSKHRKYKLMAFMIKNRMRRCLAFTIKIKSIEIGIHR